MVFTKIGSSRIEKKTWIIFGMLISFPCLLLLAPSKVFGLPGENLWMMGIGFGGVGFFDTLLCVFCLPEMIRVVEKKYHYLNDF